MKCAECKFNYTKDILSEMFVNGKHTEPICGICALDIMNRNSHSSLRRKTFDSGYAEYNRLEAIRQRKKALKTKNKGEKK